MIKCDFCGGLNSSPKKDKNGNLCCRFCGMALNVEVPSADVWIEIFEKCKKAVCSIETTDKKSTYHATGWYIGNHLVVTNAHVLMKEYPSLTPELFKSFALTFTSVDPENPLKAIPYGVDPANDVGLLYIKNDKILEGCELNIVEPDNLRIGQEIAAIGYPGLKSLDKQFNVSCLNGTIIALDEPEDYMGLVKSEDAIRTSLHIHPGNSGSPLLNKDGNAIGIMYGANVGSTGVFYDQGLARSHKVILNLIQESSKK